jgi:hypothetical protein
MFLLNTSHIFIFSRPPRHFTLETTQRLLALAALMSAVERSSLTARLYNAHDRPAWTNPRHTMGCIYATPQLHVADERSQRSPEQERMETQVRSSAKSAFTHNHKDNIKHECLSRTRSTIYSSCYEKK